MTPQAQQLLEQLLQVRGNWQPCSPVAKGNKPPSNIRPHIIASPKPSSSSAKP
ncbi:MAG: hypothetical protein HC934_11395 [Acaryochloridaceae cyanobacterium SU_2_1]|nr:hypothetical protein [Acaryochloridaceae cyanobacterium SU_2_1]